MAEEASDFLFERRYRREFKLSAQAFADEPDAALLQYRMIYAIEDERVKLEREREAFKQGNKGQ